MLMVTWNYRLVVHVEDTVGSAAGETELSLTVSHEVQLDSVTLAFSEGEVQDPINETLPYPQALATQSATLDPTQTLKVPYGIICSNAIHGNIIYCSISKLYRLPTCQVALLHMPRPFQAPNKGSMYLNVACWR